MGAGWVARRAEEREAVRAQAKERIDRIQAVVDLLALAGSSDPRQGSAKSKLRSAVRAVGEERLTAAVDAFCDTKRGEEYWPTLEIAQKLAGEVLGRAIKD